MRNIILLILIIIWSCPVRSQDVRPSYTISGYVEDELSGEKLIGAALYLVKSKTGVNSNRYGYFSLATPASATVVASYMGYQSNQLILNLTGDTLLTIRLTPKSNELNAVTVREVSGKDTYQDPTMGKFVIPLDLVRKGPALLGETDIIKTLQLLPGVQAGTEGTVGLNVRGGSADQNLILLDGMTLYNLNHLFGFFSVINTDAVAQAEFLKGSIPARYGGRLSSVLDISLREGNMNQWKGNFGLSPVAGRLTVEGPLKKNVSSVLISARRTWLDALYWLGAKVSGNNNTSGFGFYDLNVKFNYKLSDRDRLFLSFYTGNDKFSSQFQVSDARYRNSFDWGNSTLGMRWNHTYGRKLFSNTTLSYINFNYSLKEEYRAQKSYVNQVSSGIEDLTLKTDFDWYAHSNHGVRFGFGAARHAFRPEIKQYVASTADTTYQPSLPVQTGEISAYVEDDWSLSRRLRVNAGVHYANQLVAGRVWQSLQPRLSARYLIGQQASLKVSYNRMTQFLHLLTNSSVGLPTDLWVPVTDQIGPEQANWLSVGYSRSLRSTWNVSVETYYKSLYNVLDYKEGTAFQNSFSTPWYERVSIGSGTAYGAEFYLEKTVGKTKGWISYTLSWANRQFNEINSGRVFPYKYDRRHNLAMVISHDFTTRKSLSANFVYSSGSALTIASSRYRGGIPGSDLLNKESVNQYTYQDLLFFDNLPDLGNRNNFRTRAYHRLDISYRTTKQKVHSERTWMVACYNAYNRQNPFFLFYDKERLKQFSLFPAIPSVTYQYAF